MTEGAQRRVHPVPPDVGGARLDQHLARAFPDLSRARLQALIAEGQVQVDGRPAKAAQRLRGGESITLEIPAPRPARPQAEALPLEVLHEDRDLLVLDKAAGMVVHPAAGHWEGTLVNALLHRVKDLQGVGGELRPGLVHRLDKDTSGCLVIAKNEKALAGLQEAFRSRTVRKLYLALVHGVPAPKGRIETLYGRHPTQRLRFTGKVREGKPALTEFRVLEALEALGAGAAAELEVDLHTGRTHQVRVHLAELGHPLLGDALYGGLKRGKPAVREVSLALGRQALHAWKLSFPHPRSGKTVAFEAPPPEDYVRAREALRGRGRVG